MQIKARVLVCDLINESGFHVLRDAGMRVDFRPELGQTELASVIANYEVVIIRSGVKIDSDIINAASNLKVIARAGIGTDNINLDAAWSRGIKVITAPALSANSVAELVIGYMICFSRNVVYFDSMIKKGSWMDDKPVGSELYGKKLGIIGMGNIGRTVALIAGRLGMKIFAYSTGRKLSNSSLLIENNHITMTDLDTVLRNCDFVSCHIPLTSSTAGMFNLESFSKMKATAFFINTARGKVVDEDSLYRALKERKIAGAALDVFEAEPPMNEKLLGLPNVLCTPHIGAQTKEVQDLISITIAEKIASVMMGNRKIL